jgi:hypothetical protein
LSHGRAHRCRGPPYVRAAMSLRGAGAQERGQATVEWIGLMLGLALALGGALELTRGADFEGEAHGLGEALTSRMTCAARDACAAEARAERAGAKVGSGALDGSAASRASPEGGVLRGGGRGIPPRGASGPAARRLGGIDRAGARVGVRRAFEKARKYGWAACLGYRRLRYDLDHPRFFPRDTIPPGEILDELNACLNPWNFLFG